MTTGLTFPDLPGWQEWAARQRRAEAALRSVKARVRPSPPETATLHLPSGRPDTLVVLDKLTPSCRYAVHAPLAHLDLTRTAVLAFDDPQLPGDWQTTTWVGPEQLDADIDSVLSLGSYLPLSGPVAVWAKSKGLRFCVVQHGLLTPWSPPAADGDHLLAWSGEDAAYWVDGRSSVTAEVVGAQMFWDQQSVPVLDHRPVMLGQLHGVELSRRETFRVYWDFCRRERAQYRPHPNERAIDSRVAHRAMRAGGIEFEESGRPLAELGRPVVSIFSTGTLEAAQRGLPAWVTHPAPPAWVEDFWRRYRLSRWGSEPTARWERPAVEPAQAVAAAVRS